MQETLGNLHPILVHFPIVLFSLGLLCDLLNGIEKKAALPVAHWMIIGAAVMCIPTLITGWEAAEGLPPEDPNLVYVATHRLMAFITSCVGGLHALFRAFAMHRLWIFPPLVYVSCSVVTLLLVAVTADYGGLVTHGVSLFNF